MSMRTLALMVAMAIALMGQSKKYEIQAPKGTWQKPGEIRVPTGPWQKPGEIQVPKGVQAIREEKGKCEERLVIVADALFDFDQSALRVDAEETLKALGPKLKEKAARHPVTIEGHTDSLGNDAYNQTLSEKRATAVRDWLVANHYLTGASARTKGLGEKQPVAPNAKADGTDDPTSRQKNRRVEVVVESCK